MTLDDFLIEAGRRGLYAILDALVADGFRIAGS
jgi:hypothetical protein